MKKSFLTNTTPTLVVTLENKPCNLLLCFDDMAYPFASNYSNVLRLYFLLSDDDDSQRVYYERGVGRRIESDFPLSSAIISYSTVRRIRNILDNAFALYFHQRVMDGYKWLVQYYNPGDKVYFFGFSRGAYTARVLAALLHKIGLVSRDKLNNEYEKIKEVVAQGYNLFVSTGSSDEAIREFKEQYCCVVHIEFLGVWDTVSSLGFLRSPTLPFADANTSIVFRQALSLDEHRAKFQPILFRHGVPNKSELRETETDVKEVWFAGAHSDVGGGNKPGHVSEPDLANVTLRWMIEELLLLKPHIRFSYEFFALMQIPFTIGQGHPLSPPQGVPSTSEDVDELNARDAVQPITDELYKNALWWILEILPTSFTFQNPQGKWVTTYELHFGRRRRLPPGPLFHSSVKTRMDDPTLGYNPRACYEHGTEEYVS